MASVNEWADTPEKRRLLDAYWNAQTPEDERAAYAALRNLGFPPSYGEIDVSGLQTLPPEDQALVEDQTTADGIFIKRVVIPKRESWVPQHAHVWDHTTLLTSGAMFVWQDGALDKCYQAPAMIFIKAGVKHLFRTVDDGTVFYCIHNLKGAGAVEILAAHNLEETT